MTAPGFRGGLLRGGIFGLWGEQVQGEFLREGVWGEQVQGEGGAAAGLRPAPAAPPRGVRPCGAHGCAAGSCVLQGFAEGQGPGRGGRGALRFAGACGGVGVGAAAPQGRLPPRPAPAGGPPVNRRLDYRRRRGYNRGEVKTMNDHYLMISFENTHSAIRTERLLEQYFKVATMPTLRTVTQSCGISLRLAAEDYEPARKMVAESGLSPQMYAIYLVDSNKNVLELSK